MKTLKSIFLFLTVIFTSVLLIGMGMKGIGEQFPETIINFSLQGMHFSFLLGSIITIYSTFRNKQWLYLILFVIPLVLLLISFVMMFARIRFPSLGLFIFDIYLIVISVNYLTFMKKCE